MTPSVLDLSHHNDVASWDKIKASGIRGVILKCTQGTKYVDPTYSQRKADARSAGLLVGAYHFASNADPHAQVDWFLSHAQLDPELLLALDWENNPDGPDLSVAQAREFLEYLGFKARRERSHLVVYGGNVLKERITSGDDITFFADYPLWLCEYGPKAKCPKPWQKVGYWLWQYSETGSGIAGIHDGQVDLNVHGGKDLQAEWAPGFAIAAAAPQAPTQAVSSRADPATADEPAALPGPPAAVSGPSLRDIGDTIDTALSHAEAHRDLLSSSWGYWVNRISIKGIVAGSAGTLAFAKDAAIVVCASALVAILVLEIVRYLQRSHHIANLV